MNKNNVAIALFETAAAIEVTFPRSGGLYTYMTLDEVAVGDKVIVNTPQAGLQVVTVTKVNADWDIDAKYDYKFIVGRVDMSRYEEIQGAVKEVKAVIESERRAAARKAMTDTLGLKAATVAKIGKLTRL